MTRYHAVYEFEADSDDDARKYATQLDAQGGRPTLVRLEREGTYFYGLSLPNEAKLEVAS